MSYPSAGPLTATATAIAMAMARALATIPPGTVPSATMGRGRHACIYTRQPASRGRSRVPSRPYGRLE